MSRVEDTGAANALDIAAEAVASRQTPLFDLAAAEDVQPKQESLDIPAIGKGRSNVAVLECRDNLEFLRAQPSEKFKLIITSPPYNIGKSYEARTSLQAYLAGQAEVIEECIRLLHPQGSICWQVGNYTDNGEILPLIACSFQSSVSLG